MRVVRMLCGYVLAMALFWLADSLLLSSILDIPFAAALWTGVSPARMLYRLLVEVALLTVAFAHVTRRTVGDNVFMMGLQSAATSLNIFTQSENQKQRLINIALPIADYYRMERQDRDSLYVLCQIFDLGMLTMDQDFFSCRKENPDQRQLWKENLQKSVEVVGALPELAPAAPLLRYHKEHFDGSGPWGLQGKDIPLPCRILQTALAYDAFTHPANGKKKMKCQEALGELSYYAGTVLDPEIVEFLQTQMGYKGTEKAAAHAYTMHRA
ncbi:MAG: hypothetical protein K6B40_00275 [Firmicutes bacterium]|nr:hypothetical protein [Bacillota bacterium]